MKYIFKVLMQKKTEERLARVPGFTWLLGAMAFTSAVLFVHRQIKVEFSMKFTSRDLSLKRMASKKQSGVFGVKINVVTK